MIYEAFNHQFREGEAKLRTRRSIKNLCVGANLARRDVMFSAHFFISREMIGNLGVRARSDRDLLIIICLFEEKIQGKSFFFWTLARLGSDCSPLLKRLLIGMLMLGDERASRFPVDYGRSSRSLRSKKPFFIISIFRLQLHARAAESSLPDEIKAEAQEEQQIACRKLS